MNYNAIHLLDPENLYGWGRLKYDSIKTIREIYMEEVGIQEGDAVVIATAQGNRLAVFNAWPGAFYKFRDGKNGADIALAEFMSESRLAGRYSRVFLGSGDGGLAPYLHLLKNSGLDTVVVSRPRATSWRLNAFEHIDFPELRRAG